MAKFASVKIRERKKIKAPSMHSILHNNRVGKEATYLLPKEYRHPNYHSHKISNANKVWGEWVEKIEKRYNEVHKRKLRSDAVRIEEGLIVLSAEQVKQCSPDEIWSKMQEFKRWFEKRHNTEILSMDWHRDEGHINDAGEVELNEHCHFLFADVDMDGQKIRSNWKRSGEELREMQDKIAELFEPLGFERGIKNQKKEYRRPREQRQHKAKAKAEQTKAKIKDVNEENKRLREQLKQAGAKREQYAELEKEIRELKDAARSKELTVQQLNDRVKKLEKIAYTGNVVEKRVVNKITKKPVIKRVPETHAEAHKKTQEKYRKAEDRIEAAERKVKELEQKIAELEKTQNKREKDFTPTQTIIDIKKDDRIAFLEAQNRVLSAKNEELEQALDKAAKMLMLVVSKYGLNLNDLAEQVMGEGKDFSEIVSTLSTEGYPQNNIHRNL